MLDLYFIRHAECERNNEPHLIGGRCINSPLSSLGREQGRLLGRRLLQQGVLFDKVYSSTALRCKETALDVGEHLGYSFADIISLDQLLELDQGQWEGQPRVQVYTPEMLAVINADNWEFTPPGGESQRTVEERMLQFVTNELLPLDQKDKTITCAIFTHGVAMKCLLRGIMEFTPKITYRVWVDNTGIIRLHYRDDKWYIMSVNNTAHLFGAHTK